MDEKTNEIKRILAVLETLRARKTEQGRAAREWRDGTDAQAFIVRPEVDSVIRRNASSYHFKHREVINDAGAMGPEDLVGIAREKWIRWCDGKTNAEKKMSTALAVTIGQNAFKDTFKRLMAAKRKADLDAVNFITKDYTDRLNPNSQTGQQGNSLSNSGGRHHDAGVS